MDSMGTFFGVVGIGAGLYCLYGYLLMIRRHEIPKGIMLPKDVDPGKCKDVNGYIKKTSVPLLVLGLLLVIYGVLEMVNQYAVAVETPVFAAMVLSMVALIWFALCTKKANQTYFQS